MNRQFYLEAVAPVVRTQFPGLKFGAGLLGPGSEVLGYDTRQSTDHDWGPRAQIFLSARDRSKYGTQIITALEEGLPRRFGGYSTSFSPPDSDHVRVRVPPGAGRLRPLVWVGTLAGFLRGYLGVASERRLAPIDWLSLPQHKLLTVAEGAVFHDDVGIRRMQARFRYYPRDVWLHLLSVQWLRIAEEEAFVARAAAVEDDLGSRMIAARQVREIMRLCFLMEKRYWPYDKWWGTGFRKLEISRDLHRPLCEVLEARTGRARERALSRTYE
ncbi:MAG: DUF4037 domain-containing protein, partial [Thermoplasmata archaeon]|nr:DUF4037 domain-containing protein [Thermoplasmata archaeon]